MATIEITMLQTIGLSEPNSIVKLYYHGFLGSIDCKYKYLSRMQTFSPEVTCHLRMAVNAAALPLDFRAVEWDGTHEWYFWDRSLVEFIDFIEGDGYANQKQTDWAHPAR